MVQSPLLILRAGNSPTAATSLQKDGSATLCRFFRSTGQRSSEFAVEAWKIERKICAVNVSRFPRAFLQTGDTTPASCLSAESNGKQWTQEETKSPRSPPPKVWKSETGRRIKKKYSKRIIAILKSLKERPYAELEQALEEWKGKLEVREQSVILNEENSWVRVLRIFSWLQHQDNYSPNVFHYNIVLKVLGRAEKFELVEKLWEEMEKKVLPTNISYSTVIHAYGKAGNPEKALMLFEDMKRRGFEPDDVTMNTLVNLHKQNGNVDAAETAFYSFSRNVEACNTMIDLYGRVGRYAEASRIFSEMMEAGISADTVTFNTMIKVCGLAGRPEEAEAMFNSMTDNGLSPDVATFNALLGLFVKVGKVQKSLDYFSRMKETEIVPDQVTFNTLLSALALLDMVSDAEAVAKEMDELGISAGEVVTVGLARMYVRAGLLDKAAQLLTSYGSSACLSSSSLAALIDSYAEESHWREAEELFIRWKQSWSVENFNTMIKAYGLAARHGKALEVFTNMEDQGISPDEVTFNTIIHTLASVFPVDVEKIEQVISEMRKKGYELHRSSFNVLIGIYGRLGNVRQAEQTFDQMKTAGIAPDGVSFGALLNAFAEKGCVNEAERAAIAMREAGFAPNRIVYTTLMKLYAKMNNLDQVKKIYANMGRAGVGPDLFAANFLIDQYGKAGQLNDAERIFGELVDASGKLGVNEVTFTVMLDMYKKSGRVHEALGMAKRMLNMDGLKDIVSYNSILGLYVTTGRGSEALEVFHSLDRKHVDPDMVTYSIMGGILKRVGSLQEALDLFTTGTAAGLPETMQSLTTVVSLYTRVGLVKEAFEACEKLFHGGFTLDNPAYNVMIYAYGTAGRFDESLRLFMEMQNCGLKPDAVTYATVIAVYGKAGSLEGVNRIFKRMKQEGCEPTMATYNVVIDIYRNAGMLDRAAMIQQEMQFAQYLRGKKVYYGYEQS